MKKIIFAVMLVAFALLSLPASSLAHTGDTGDVQNADSMPMMSERSAGEVSPEEFEEMEDIMLKMMNGEDLSGDEWQEMAEFMDSHHGAGFWSMAGNGMMFGSGFGRYGMMDEGFGWGHGSLFARWLFTVTTLVWLLAGILLIAFLFRKLSK